MSQLNKFSFCGFFLCMLLLSFLNSCSPTPGPDKTFTGAVLGAGWGAGAGAVIGNQTGNLAQGAGWGAAFGGVSGAVTGAGLDIAEGTELEQSRKLDALKVQLASNQNSLYAIQNDLDNRERKLAKSAIIDRVFFDPDSAAIRIGSAVQLERLANIAKLNPHLGSIEVHGHSDDTGMTERNLRLSEARARTIANYIASQGISTDQIKTFAHGAKQPIASNENDSGRQLNRRVEIVFIQ